MHPILKAHIEKKEFSHAYLLCGDAEACRQAAFDAAMVILSPQNGVLENHPDFLHKSFGLFSIGDSHDLISWSGKKSFSENGKVFVAEIFAFNAESANALLKTLEEPGEKTYFFVIVSSLDNVIPALRSRFVIIDLPLGNLSSKYLEVSPPSEFLGATANKRMEIIKTLIAKKEDGDGLSENLVNKQKAINILNSLEIILEKELRNKNAKAALTALEELSKAREFVFDKGASVKMILEHLALALPKF